jgi:hypothetical protein
VATTSLTQTVIATQPRSRYYPLPGQLSDTVSVVAELSEDGHAVGSTAHSRHRARGLRLRYSADVKLLFCKAISPPARYPAAFSDDGSLYRSDDLAAHRPLGQSGIQPGAPERSGADALRYAQRAGLQYRRRWLFLARIPLVQRRRGCLRDRLLLRSPR